MRHQAGSDTRHVGPRRASTTISCGSITQIFVNLTIPSRSSLSCYAPDCAVEVVAGPTQAVSLAFWVGVSRIAASFGSHPRPYASFRGSAAQGVSRRGVRAWTKFLWAGHCRLTHPSHLAGWLRSHDGRCAAEVARHLPRHRPIGSRSANSSQRHGRRLRPCVRGFPCVFGGFEARVRWTYNRVTIGSIPRETPCATHWSVPARRPRSCSRSSPPRRDPLARR